MEVDKNVLEQENLLLKIHAVSQMIPLSFVRQVSENKQELLDSVLIFGRKNDIF